MAVARPRGLGRHQSSGATHSPVWQLPDFLRPEDTIRNSFREHTGPRTARVPGPASLCAGRAASLHCCPLAASAHPRPVSPVGQMGPAAAATGLWLLQDAPQLKNLLWKQIVLVHNQPSTSAGSPVPNRRIKDLNSENLSHWHIRCISHDPGCLGPGPAVLREDCLGGVQGEDAESLCAPGGSCRVLCNSDRAVDSYLWGTTKLFCGLSHLKKKTSIDCRKTAWKAVENMAFRKRSNRPKLY